MTDQCGWKLSVVGTMQCTTVLAISLGRLRPRRGGRLASNRQAMCMFCGRRKDSKIFWNTKHCTRKKCLTGVGHLIGQLVAAMVGHAWTLKILHTVHTVRAKIADTWRLLAAQRHKTVYGSRQFGRGLVDDHTCTGGLDELCRQQASLVVIQSRRGTFQPQPWPALDESRQRKERGI